MKRTLSAAAALAALAATGAPAAEPEPGVRLGAEPGAISAALGESGWRMTRFERENGRVELTAVKEGRRVEAYVDAATGEVVRVEERERRGPPGAGGMDDAEIRARLKAEGYAVDRYEREHGRVEVYATRDGRRYELKIDPRDGRVLEVEREDD